MSEKPTKPINSIVPEENGSQPRDPSRRRFLTDMRNLTVAVGTGYIMGSNSPKESTPTPTMETRGGVPTEAQLAEMLGEQDVSFIKDGDKLFMDVNVQEFLNKAAERGVPNPSLEVAVVGIAPESLEFPKKTRPVIISTEQILREQEQGNNKGPGILRFGIKSEEDTPEEYNNYTGEEIPTVYIPKEIWSKNGFLQASKRTAYITVSSEATGITRNESGSYSMEGEKVSHEIGVSIPKVEEFEDYPGAGDFEELPGGNPPQSELTPPPTTATQPPINPLDGRDRF